MTKRTNNNYRIIFLDWNGTLSNSKFWGHLEKENNEKFKIIENTLFGDLRTLIKPWMRGNLETEKVMKEMSDKSGLSYSYVFDEFIHSCMNMEYVSLDIPNIVKKIQKKGMKVVIATDNMDSFNRWTLRYMKDADIFDDVINSFYKNGMKKDVDENGKSLFFSDYISKYKLKPGESVLIDDSSDDIDTIRGFGIDYIHIKSIDDTITALNNLVIT